MCAWKVCAQCERALEQENEREHANMRRTERDIASPPILFFKLILFPFIPDHHLYLLAGFSPSDGRSTICCSIHSFGETRSLCFTLGSLNSPPPSSIYPRSRFTGHKCNTLLIDTTSCLLTLDLCVASSITKVIKLISTNIAWIRRSQPTHSWTSPTCSKLQMGIDSAAASLNKMCTIKMS